MPGEILNKRVTPGELSKRSMYRIPQDTQIPIHKTESVYGFHNTTRESIVPIARGSWDGVERRQPCSCRRQSSERRTYSERRQDTRINCNARRSVKARIRSIIGVRLGVDRRKGADRRVNERRFASIRSLVTPEELDALLSL